jgi:hypothetical protein
MEEKENSEKTKIKISEPVRLLYEHNYNETIRFRNYEWQIAVWATTFLAVISTVPKNYFKDDPRNLFIAHCLAIFTLGFGIICVYQIWKCHKNLAISREIIWKIEKSLGAYDLKLNKSEDPLLPKKWGINPDFNRGRLEKWFWTISIICVMFFALYQILVLMRC